MKYFVLISCLIAIIYAKSGEEVVSKLIGSGKISEVECTAESQITEEEIKKLKNFEIPTTTAAKCFVFCIIKDLKFMTEDGKFIQENGYKFLNELKELDTDLYEKLSNIANTCFAEVQELPDPCETATNMFICVEREKKVNGVEYLNKLIT